MVLGPGEALTVPAMLRYATTAFGDREAVVSLDTRTTFQDLDAASRRVARALVAAGVGTGSRIGAQFSYGAEWLVTFLAVTRAGAIFVPLSTAYKPAELRKTVRHADLAVLISPRRLFGTDRLDVLEETLPGLAPQPAGRLALPAAPFLRAVWIGGGADRAWATPVDLRPTASAGPAEGAEHADVTDVILDALESEVTPADLAVSIYTSGTTAEPKGVVHTHGALARKTWAMIGAKGISADDRVFCGMPFFWVGGLMQGVMRALASGGMLLCLERPDPEPALDLMEREQATHIIGWPGVTGPILAHPSAAGRNVPALGRPPTKRAGLGMTETLAGYSSSATVTSVPEGERGACMGRVNANTEVKIVDPDTGEQVPDGTSGAILVRGFCVIPTAGTTPVTRAT
jgi:acyl-CoA synthetase (AMP-forming)/AMP-acid ligase II